MTIDLKTLAPDTTLPQDGFLFGADSQSATNPSVYPVANVKDAINSGIATLASAPAIMWDCAAAPVATVTLTQNATLYASNFKAGGSYKLIVFQDATGGRTLGYDPNFKWPNDTIPTVSSGANAMTVFEFVSNGTYLYGTVSQAYDGSPAPTVSGLFAAPAGDYSTLTTTTSMPTGGSISRAGNAMHYDSTGLLTYAPNNLVLRSQEFDNAAWSKLTSTVTPNASTAPDGTSTADKLIGTSGSTNIRVQQAVSLVAGASYVYSIYAKAAEYSNLRVQRVDTNINPLTHDFNLSTGTASGGGTITSLGNGWYRCSGVVVCNTTASTGPLFIAQPGATGDGTSGLLIWGAQLRAVTYQTAETADLSTYYPTTTAAYYGPRFDYDPATLQPKGLLVEGGRSNLLTYSEQFDNAAWLQSGTLPVTPNAIVSPDGTQNADLIAATTSVNDFRYQSLTLVLNSQNTFSFFIKNNNSTRSRIVVRNTVTSLDAQLVWAGAVLSVTNVVGTTTATAVGNGWYRVEGRFIALETSVQARVYPDTLVGTNSAYFWGAQFEAASFASSYMPSVAAASTRVADTFTISGYANRLVEAYWIEQETGVVSSFPETVVSSGAVTISPPTFGWVTSLRAYTNAYAGDIPTPSWIDNSGTTGNRMVTDSTGTLTWAPHNLLLNSATLTTQTVPVTVGATNILSFYGTGSVTLSGAATGTLTGTGANNRVSLIITPTTTSLTLTVSGSVTQAQLERVTYQTQPRAYIPTTSAAVFLPRYDYDASTTPATPRGMLIEEARSNLLTYSEQFDNAAWAVGAINMASPVVNSATAPDGTQSADKIIPNTTNGFHRASNQLTVSAAVHVFSAYLKAGGLTKVKLQTYDTGSGTKANVDFDLSAGSIIATTTGTGFITAVGNGWYRCAVVSASAHSAGATQFWVAPLDAAGTNSFAGDGVSGVIVWGAQVEVGAWASSYMPSVNGANRVADVVRLTGAALTVLSGTAASAVVEYANLPAAQISGAAPWSLIGNSGGINGLIRINGNTTFQSYAGGVTISATLGGGNFTTASGGRAAVAFNGVGRSIVGGNGTVVSDANAPSGLSSGVWLGSASGSASIGGNVKSIALYNSRLPDATLKAKSAVGAAY